MSFREAQKEVDDWISRQHVGYWQPLAMLARVSEEVGELAREINHRYGERDEAEGDLPVEIADTIFVLLSLANSLGIDMDEAWKRMMEKYRTRDADRWRNVE